VKSHWLSQSHDIIEALERQWYQTLLFWRKDPSKDIQAMTQWLIASRFEWIRA